MEDSFAGLHLEVYRKSMQPGMCFSSLKIGRTGQARNARSDCFTGAALY